MCCSCKGNSGVREPSPRSRSFGNPKSSLVVRRKIQCVGHWFITAVNIEQFIYKGVDRSATITLKLDHYSEEFSKIIKDANGTDDDTNPKVAERADEVVLVTVKSAVSIDNSSQEEQSGIRKKDTQMRNRRKHSRATAIAAGEETVLIAVGNGHQKEFNKEDDQMTYQKRRHEAAATSSDDEQGDSKRAAVAETVTSGDATIDDNGSVVDSAQQERYLEDYTAAEVAQLVASKGSKFQALAEQLQDADVQGAFLVDELKKGEDHFMSFLHDKTGLKNGLLRFSVFKSFQQIPTRMT